MSLDYPYACGAPEDSSKRASEARCRTQRLSSHLGGVPGRLVSADDRYRRLVPFRVAQKSTLSFFAEQEMQMTA